MVAMESLLWRATVLIEVVELAVFVLCAIIGCC
jgi:hypothetical protein